MISFQDGSRQNEKGDLVEEKGSQEPDSTTSQNTKDKMDTKIQFSDVETEAFGSQFDDNAFGGVSVEGLDSMNLHDYMPGPEVGFRFSTRLYLPEDIFRAD